MSSEHERSRVAFFYLFIVCFCCYVLFVSLYFIQRHLFRVGCCCCKRRDPYDESQTCRLEICHENEYRSWTVEQVVQWAQLKLISSRPKNQSEPSLLCGSHYSRVITNTVSVLQAQCIDGTSVEYLTLQHLLSFGIPFGIAVHLMKEFGRLVSQQSNTGEAMSQHTLQSDLVVLPSWYESGNMAANKVESASNATDEEMGIEMQRTIQQIMQDKFGMTLPSLRMNSNHSTVNGNVSDVEIEPNELAGAPQMKHTDKSIPTSTRVGTDSNMKHILRNMPPHVRAIAKRRPELVSKLLREMSQSQQNHASHSSHVQDTITHEEDDSCDSEYAGLLRRRIHTPDDNSR